MVNWVQGTDLYSSQPGRSLRWRIRLRSDLLLPLLPLLLLLPSAVAAAASALACCCDLKRATSAAASASSCQSMPWSNSLHTTTAVCMQQQQCA